MLHVSFVFKSINYKNNEIVFYVFSRVHPFDKFLFKMWFCKSLLLYDTHLIVQGRILQID